MSQLAIQSNPDELIYTVTELTRKVKRLLESHWAAFWVEGELSNVKRHASGHVYFTLKDERASLRGIMFRSKAARLVFDPEDGQKVRVFGSLTVYEPQGSYQVNAVRMDPVGIGELEIAFRQMYERLEREGLFDPGLKRPVPKHPKTVGIVTSESGAAIRDVFNVLGRRAPHVRILVCPTRVQGSGAGRDVAEAIRRLDEWGGIDVAIVARGGGSLEDLWAFNEEIVARAIYSSRVPIISGVGHEVDMTIADFAADLRAPTPSAAAELAVPERAGLLRAVRELSHGLTAGMSQFLRERRDRVNVLAESSAFQDPLEYYRRRTQDVDAATERLTEGMKRVLERLRLVHRAAAGRLSALSPLAILDRGYAIVRDPSGRLVRRARDARVGGSVEVQLAEGGLACTVERALEAEELKH